MPMNHHHSPVRLWIAAFTIAWSPLVLGQWHVQVPDSKGSDWHIGAAFPEQDREAVPDARAVKSKRLALELVLSMLSNCGPVHEGRAEDSGDTARKGGAGPVHLWKGVSWCTSERGLGTRSLWARKPRESWQLDASPGAPLPVRGASSSRKARAGARR